jgi:polyhydroxyalkanoate synthase subunit PhaC
VTVQSSNSNTLLKSFCVLFDSADLIRGAQGEVLGAFGLDPTENYYQVSLSGAFWRLRDYDEHDAAPSVLIVAAPIKRPYIWELDHSTSVIRYMLSRGLRVHLLEWLPASRTTSQNGFTEYIAAISECVARISRKRTGLKPFLMGHSLGGTLAAIFAASESDSTRGLLLLGAPLCFQSETSRFRDALVSIAPSGLGDAGPCPGSLLSHMSALASPNTFIWSRLSDAIFSLTDGHALEVHARVERWALDEVPVPGELVHQMIEWLFREDRFSRGKLKIGKGLVGPHTLSAPTLAVVNNADEIAPVTSVKPFIDEMPIADTRIIESPGEIGVCLQHLSSLIGRKARAQVWPEIVSWIYSHQGLPFRAAS